jgi:hypothetical protein
MLLCLDEDFLGGGEIRDAVESLTVALLEIRHEGEGVISTGVEGITTRSSCLRTPMSGVSSKRVNPDHEKVEIWVLPMLPKVLLDSASDTIIAAGIQGGRPGVQVWAFVYAGVENGNSTSLEYRSYAGVEYDGIVYPILHYDKVHSPMIGCWVIRYSLGQEFPGRDRSKMILIP